MKQKLEAESVSSDELSAPNGAEIYDARLLHNLAVGFELTNAAVVVILLIFAWYFQDRQSLIIPSVMGLIGMPLIDMSRRYFARGLIHKGVIGSSLVAWLTALVVGFFASIVPVIFAVSAVISFVPAIVAVPTVSSSLLLVITVISTLVCAVSSLFLLMPAYLLEGVPARVIAELVAIVVPVILCLSSVALWYGNHRLQQALIKAQQVNKALAEQHRLEVELKQQQYLQEQARLDAERASLESLRYQLNPHFLFNSLASIRGAIRKDTHVAREMVTALADFCRLSLTRGAIEVLPLEDEVEAVRIYLKMEQIRSGNNLQLEFSVPQDLERFMMPAFVLQPLVENSIKYGRRTSPAPLKIEIEISASQTLSTVIPLESGYIESGLNIRVSNTGKWVEETEDSDSASTGIGLRNLRQRLYKFYGEQAQLTHQEMDGWVHIEVRLPSELQPTD